MEDWSEVMPQSDVQQVRINYMFSILKQLE